MCHVRIVAVAVDHQSDAEQSGSFDTGASGIAVAPVLVIEDAGAEEAAAEREVACRVAVVSVQVDHRRCAEEGSAEVVIIADVGVVPVEVDDQWMCSDQLPFPSGGVLRDRHHCRHINDAEKVTLVDIVAGTTECHLAKWRIPDACLDRIAVAGEWLAHVVGDLQSIDEERNAGVEKSCVVEVGSIFVEELLAPCQPVALGRLHLYKR